MCKSAKTRMLPKGANVLFAYRPPTANLRMVGASAEAANKNAIQRVHDAQDMGGTELVICADCGTVYARELSAASGVLTSKPVVEKKATEPAPAPAPEAPKPPEKTRKPRGGGK
jgi:hypothetical protein